MPLVAFECAESGKRVSFDECLACAETESQPCQFTYPVIKGIIEEMKPRKGISITNLIGCLRSTILEQKYDYIARPDHLYWAFRGIIAHQITAKYATPGVIVETEFEREIAGIILRGHPDYINVVKKLIRDYKTCKAVPSEQRKYCYDNHAEQLNAYRWLVEPQYEVNRLEIQYFDMNEAKRCLPAEIWTLEKTEKIIAARATIIRAGLEDGVLPEKKETWKCNGYCNVKQVCCELA